MKKLHLITIIILVMGLIVGCTDNKNKISKEDCTKNWAICEIFPNRFYIEATHPVKLAILDSGINGNVESLHIKIENSFNTLTGTKITKDEFGHGTMIAGIIAAGKENGNLRGINPNVDIYDVQVLDENGHGKIEDVVEGIMWSIDNNVDVINLSFGYSKDDPILKEAITQALDKGIVIVASAGNTLGTSVEYPAKYPGVYSVSAINKDLKKYMFAGEGKVDFVAPGVDIPVINHEGVKELQSGTSFATAYATGVITLLLSREENYRNIDATLQNNIKYLGSEEKFGNGLLRLPN